MVAPSRPAQQFVPIKEIRNDVVVLKDGSLRALLIASSLNFALKSEDEQNATLVQFQSFLNSLDFPIQIVIQSRDLDIRPYIGILEERLAEQTIDLIKTQTREYINFIKGFTETVNIMSKNFFVVVPYNKSLTQTQQKGIFSQFFSSKNKTSNGSQNETFEEYRGQLEQRIGVVEQGLSRSGIRTARLGTEELVEVFYKLFNPGDLEKPIQMNQL